MKTNELPKLVHIGRILMKGQKQYLYLRQLEPLHFSWFDPTEEIEKETSVSAETAGRAIYLARRHWKIDHFQTINCGFRYTLPERDEHGYNALYYQMAASYSASNGIYFDEEIGNNCFVNFASQEALALWKKLR